MLYTNIGVVAIVLSSDGLFVKLPIYGLPLATNWKGLVLILNLRDELESWWRREENFRSTNSSNRNWNWLSDLEPPHLCWLPPLVLLLRIVNYSPSPMVLTIRYFPCYLCWLSHHVACYWSIPQVIACMDKLAWEARVFFNMLIWDYGDWCFSELADASILLLNHWTTCGLLASSMSDVFISAHKVLHEILVTS